MCGVSSLIVKPQHGSTCYCPTLTGARLYFEFTFNEKDPAHLEWYRRGLVCKTAESATAIAETVIKKPVGV
jgi:hypothetical protein